MDRERLRLKDKVIIITGGAEGIGRAYAMGMANEGAKLVISDLNIEAAEKTVQDLKAKGTDAVATKTDVSSLEDTLEMAKQAVDHFGAIDVLVNNAAMLGRVRVTRVPFYELDLAEWDRVLEVNLKGTLLCSRAVFSQMKAQGSGKIINVTTSGFFFGNPNYVHYVSSKAGVIGLTRAMARELGGLNINVNCIAPGATLADDPEKKEIYEARMQRLSQLAVPKQSFKRVELPEDLVGTAIFLASSDSDFITGQTIVVDGGDVMH